MHMPESGNSQNNPNRTLPPDLAVIPDARDVVKAIAAPLRRRMLRALHEADEARSPNEMAMSFALAVGHVSYHAKVLRECGVIALTDTRPRRGAIEHFYASTVTDHELVVKVLEATHAEDEQGARS